jgi:hypothetical protein
MESGGAAAAGLCRVRGETQQRDGGVKSVSGGFLLLFKDPSFLQKRGKKSKITSHT